MYVNDTIAAIATPAGRGGVGIIRLSGPKASHIAEAMLGSVPKANRAVHRLFLGNDGRTLDDGIAIYFPGPNSFTGEDVLELQGHGGKIVMDMLLQACLRMYVEAALDFPEEEIDFLADQRVLDRLEHIQTQLGNIFDKAKQGSLLREGFGTS